MERSENQIAINNEMLNELVISHELYASEVAEVLQYRDKFEVRGTDSHFSMV